MTFEDIVNESKSMVQGVCDGLNKLIDKNEMLTAKWEDLYERLNK